MSAMTLLYERLAEIANTKNSDRVMDAHELKIIRASAINMQDAAEAREDNERVITEQRLRIAELEKHLTVAQNKAFEIYINLSAILKGYLKQFGEAP